MVAMITEVIFVSVTLQQSQSHIYVTSKVIEVEFYKAASSKYLLPLVCLASLSTMIIKQSLMTIYERKMNKESIR